MIIIKTEATMKRHILIIGVLLGSISLTNAQSLPKHRLSINTGGGIQGLNYKLNVAGSDHANNLGYAFGAAYQYFFNKRWGIGIGVGLATYRSEGMLNNYQASYPAIDVDADPYLMNVSVNGLKEKQAANFLEIPVTARCQIPLKKALALWAGAGIQVGIPLSASYKTQNGSITTTGYYEQYGWTAKDIPAQGFYTDDLSGRTDDLNIKMAFSSLLEAGIGYNISKCITLTAGLYNVVGLNNINNEQQNPSGIISTDGNYNNYNSLFASGLPNSVRPFATGIKLGLSLSF